MSTRFMLGGRTAYARGESALRFAIVLIGLSVAASAVAAAVPVRLSDLNATTSELAPRLMNYPPKFSTPEERVRTEARRQLGRIDASHGEMMQITSAVHLLYRHFAILLLV